LAPNERQDRREWQIAIDQFGIGTMNVSGSILIGASVIALAILTAGFGGPFVAPYRLAVEGGTVWRLNSITGEAVSCEIQADDQRIARRWDACVLVRSTEWLNDPLPPAKR
jgi:hypothetical protein